MVPATFIAEAHDTAFNLDATLVAITPGGVSPSDVLIAVVACGDSRTVTPPAGWDALVSLSTSTLRCHVHRRVVTADEPSSHTFTLSGAPSAREPFLALLHYRGVDPTAAVVASGITAITASASFVAPSLTQARYSDVLLLVYFADDNITFTPAAGTTERLDINAATPDTAVMIADHHRELVGSTGTKTATASGAATGYAASILLAAEATPQAETLTLDPPGALGLPSVGV